MVEVTEAVARLYDERLINRVLLLAIGIALPAAVVVSGMAGRLRAAIETRVPARWWLASVLLFFLAYKVIAYLVVTPIEWWRVFRLNQEFGLTRMTTASWLARDLGQWLVGLLVMAPLVVLAYWLARRLPRRWWVVFAIAFTAHGFAMTILYPVVVEPMFAEFAPMQDKALEARVRQLAAQAGIPQADILVEDTSSRSTALNAYVTGFFSTPRIVFTDNLLRSFTPAEVLQTASHEIGHHVLRHAWVDFVVLAVVTVATLAFVAWAAPHLIARHGERWNVRALHDPASYPLVLVLVSVAGLVSEPLTNAVSRENERGADRFELTNARDVEACVANFVRFNRENLSHPDPPAWSLALFHSHPSLKERIARCRGEVE